MHKHLLRLVPRPVAPEPRPAKVVQLEARRQARLGQARKPLELPTRPAA